MEELIESYENLLKDIKRKELHVVRFDEEFDKAVEQFGPVADGIDELKKTKKENHEELEELKRSEKTFGSDKNLKTVTMEIIAIEKEVRKKELELQKKSLEIQEYYQKLDELPEGQKPEKSIHDYYREQDAIKAEIKELNEKAEKGRNFLAKLKELNEELLKDPELLEKVKADKQEPAQEEPTQEEPAQEEPTQEEPAQEEPAQEEPAQEEPTQEEPAQEEPAQEEPAQEEPAQGEPAQGEPAQGEPAQEEPAQEEPAQEEPAQGEPAQGEPEPIKIVGYKADLTKNAVEVFYNDGTSAFDNSPHIRDVINSDDVPVYSKRGRAILLEQITEQYKEATGKTLFLSQKQKATLDGNLLSLLFKTDPEAAVRYVKCVEKNERFEEVDISYNSRHMIEHQDKNKVRFMERRSINQFIKNNEEIVGKENVQYKHFGDTAIWQAKRGLHTLTTPFRAIGRGFKALTGTSQKMISDRTAYSRTQKAYMDKFSAMDRCPNEGDLVQAGIKDPMMQGKIIDMWKEDHPEIKRTRTPDNFRREQVEAAEKQEKPVQETAEQQPARSAEPLSREDEEALAAEVEQMLAGNDNGRDDL